jgi:hypothetical protein
MANNQMESFLIQWLIWEEKVEDIWKYKKEGKM